MQFAPSKPQLVRRPIDQSGNFAFELGEAGVALCCCGAKYDQKVEFAMDSPLESTGFELRVRGRGECDCRPFVQPTSAPSLLVIKSVINIKTAGRGEGSGFD